MAKVTNRTIQWAHTLTIGDRLVAQGSVTCVCVKLQADGTFTAVPMPQDILDKLKSAVRTD
jgi:acyl-CoA thioesterase FadM